METPRRLRFVSYAVNGGGLGHVVRQCAINRWLRRYARFAGVHTEHWFLTTSEADTLLFHEGFASFKLPSKSVLEPAGIEKLEYLALARQWIWSSLATLRPDLLLVDTFPGGSFDELGGALDLCRRKALVLRPVRAEVAERPAFRALLPLYDRIIVPEPEGTPLPGLADANVGLTHVGPIVLTERFEALPREEARRRLGVTGDAFCLLVAAGGGGDATVTRLLDAAEVAVRERHDVHLVLAAGPLYPGPPRRGPRLTFWNGPRLAECFCGVDAAISAAGFNTVHELLHFGIPTALVPQNKVADDQEARVDALVRAGAALRVRLDVPGDLDQAIGRLRDSASAAQLARAAAERVPQSAARHAAAELLALLLPPSLVRQATSVVNDALIGWTRARGLELESLVDVAIGLLGGGKVVDRAALELDAARELVDEAQRRGVSLRQAVQLATLAGRRWGGDGTDPEAAAEAAGVLLAHPACDGQWSALVMLLQRLPYDRQARHGLRREEPALLDAVGSTLGVAFSCGLDLFRVVDEVARAEAAGGGTLDATALLGRVRTSLAAPRSPA